MRRNEKKEEDCGMRMVEDGEWWFTLWIVRRNEKKEDECGW